MKKCFVFFLLVLSTTGIYAQKTDISYSKVFEDQGLIYVGFTAKVEIGDYTDYNPLLYVSFDGGKSYHQPVFGVELKDGALAYENMLIWNPMQSKALHAFMKTEEALLQIVLQHKQGYTYGYNGELGSTEKFMVSEYPEPPSPLYNDRNITTLLPRFDFDNNIPKIDKIVKVKDNNEGAISVLFDCFPGNKVDLKDYSISLSFSYDNGQSYHVLREGLDFEYTELQKGRNKIYWYPSKSMDQYLAFKKGAVIIRLLLSPDEPSPKFGIPAKFGSLYFQLYDSYLKERDLAERNAALPQEPVFRPILHETENFLFRFNKPFLVDNFGEMEMWIPVMVLRTGDGKILTQSGTGLTLLNRRRNFDPAVDISYPYSIDASYEPRLNGVLTRGRETGAGAIAWVNDLSFDLYAVEFEGGRAVPDPRSGAYNWNSARRGYVIAKGRSIPYIKTIHGMFATLVDREQGQDYINFGDFEIDREPRQLPRGMTSFRIFNKEMIMFNSEDGFIYNRTNNVLGCRMFVAHNEEYPEDGLPEDFFGRFRLKYLARDNRNQLVVRETRWRIERRGRFNHDENYIWAFTIQFQIEDELELVEILEFCPNFNNFIQWELIVPGNMLEFTSFEEVPEEEEEYEDPFGVPNWILESDPDAN